MRTALVLGLVHWLAGVVLLAEALNKIERTDLFRPGLSAWQRLGALRVMLVPWSWTLPVAIQALKLLAWCCLAIGAADAIVTPFLPLQPPSMQDVAPARTNEIGRAHV